MKYYYYSHMRNVGSQISYGTGVYCSDEGLSSLFVDASSEKYIVICVQEISEQDFNVLHKHYTGE